MSKLVSIITVTYNNAPYLQEAADSVFKQSHQHWEWIIVNNGSTDQTREVLGQLNDPRIRVVHLDQNIGVSAGRNVGISHSTGEFLCFLDGDDVLPPRSLEARLLVFDQDPSVAFVDGGVLSFQGQTSNVIDTYVPTFRGQPLERLLSLDASVFKGNTWMIKRMEGVLYAFDPAVSYGEELLFYATICAKGRYDFTEFPVLFYRRHDRSAMNNLNALAQGYSEVGKRLKRLGHVHPKMLGGYKRKAAMIIFKSFLKKREPINALMWWLKLQQI